MPSLIAAAMVETKSKGQPMQDRKGFSVARRAGKGAYTGKASKIKEQLIQKAKVKKEYANMLKKEGQPAQQLPEIPKKARRSERDKPEGSIKRSDNPQQKQPQPQTQPQKKEAPSHRQRRRDQHSKNHNNQPKMGARMETMLDKVKKTVS
ncbi:hypothetical protein E3P77_02025 [Wallemia ichthyophaga]|uniref:rRNA-processing protein FYV7 n=1 Tax=Wallemia ichthyophaga (strain EXF-994 / CBS 113033) TaxID=1299270 RepID=R9ADU8_WALI9|nr:uncharacterized protein J056_000895 [Wallemia ichthyophaga EXF-994]TIA92401.1 hypothetical protein E3P97_01491 [Wallemia ichthyophaga]EOR00357.1 hypothetical protein J056_000895 [Wallemia ichthyophaga EXF-994]TIB00110.1 hypothetical protein E3P96_02728 [Wallemia ichthyophaga]TIB32183.1 hypothetical protein E3P85_01992 [Wallemia ichthyophaga]TIB48029.1 hypothetical protein E3P82_01489 [Wallemia ichthyophaga]